MWKWMFRLSAEPKRWISITAPVAPVTRVSRAAVGGKVVATLAKTDEMTYMGEEQNGYLKVESGSGWVKKILVAK